MPPNPPDGFPAFAAPAPASLATSDLLQLLAGDVRRALVWRLARGPADVTELCRAIDSSMPTGSHHLRTLRTAGLVAREPCARRRIYRLAGPVGVEPVDDQLHLNFTTQDGLRVRLSRCATAEENRRSPCPPRPPRLPGPSHARPPSDGDD